MIRRPASPGQTIAARTVISASLVVTIASLPVFLLGSTASLIREEVDFGPSRLGLSVALFWLVVAIASVPAGRITERINAFKANLLCAGGMSALIVTMAGFASSGLQIIVCIAVAGVFSAFAAPATNLAMADAVPVGRLGAAFGVKQSAAPLATLLAGFAVPVLALTLGWRAPFFVVPALLPFLVVVMPDLRFAKRGDRGPQGISKFSAQTMLVTGALGLGSAAGISLATFFVSSSIEAGLSASYAGLLQGFGSLVGIGVRVASGLHSDRSERDPLHAISGMLCIGSLGFIALSFDVSTPLLVATAAICFGAGWGWTSLFFLRIVRRNMANPGSATGAVFVGNAVGSGIGPFIFGIAVTKFSYASAWRGAAASLLLAALLLEVSRAHTTPQRVDEKGLAADSLG